LKAARIIGFLSEALLVAGALCVAAAYKDIYVCLHSFCPYLLAPQAEYSSGLGLILLVASAIGFFVSLLFANPANLSGTGEATD